MKYILIPFPKEEKRKIKKISFCFDRGTRTSTPNAYVTEYEIINSKKIKL